MVVKNLQEAVEKSGVNFPNPEVIRMQKTGADWHANGYGALIIVGLSAVHYLAYSSQLGSKFWSLFNTAKSH